MLIKGATANWKATFTYLQRILCEWKSLGKWILGNSYHMQQQNKHHVYKKYHIHYEYHYCHRINQNAHLLPAGQIVEKSSRSTHWGRPAENGQYFADKIFKYIFVIEKVYSLIYVSLKSFLWVLTPVSQRVELWLAPTNHYLTPWWCIYLSRSFNGSAFIWHLFDKPTPSAL